jgi:hypothetical protein
MWQLGMDDFNVDHYDGDGAEDLWPGSITHVED